MAWKLKSGKSPAGPDEQAGPAEESSSGTPGVADGHEGFIASSVNAADSAVAEWHAAAHGPTEGDDTHGLGEEESWSLDAFAPYQPPVGSDLALNPLPVHDVPAGEVLEFGAPVHDVPRHEPEPFVSVPEHEPDVIAPPLVPEQDKTAYMIDSVSAAPQHTADLTSPPGESAQLPPALSAAAPAPTPAVTHSASNGTVPSQVTALAPEPSAPRHARVTVKLGAFTAPYEITGSDLMIGRPDPGSSHNPEIAIEWDDAISRRHALVTHRSDGDYVQDIGSKNGTRLNGEPLAPNKPSKLRSGDTIKVGERTEIVYEA